MLVEKARTILLGSDSILMDQLTSAKTLRN